MCVCIHLKREGEPSSCRLVLIPFSPLLRKGLSVWWGLCFIGVYLFLLFVLHLKSGDVIVALRIPLHSNPLGQLEQRGGAAGGEDLWKTGESSPANTLRNKETWGRPHGISPVGLACKIFISSAYDSRGRCVLRKCLTAFKCPVLSRVSLCGVAFPWAILLGTALLPLPISSALYRCHAKL